MLARPGLEHSHWCCQCCLHVSAIFWDELLKPAPAKENMLHRGRLVSAGKKKFRAVTGSSLWLPVFTRFSSILSLLERACNRVVKRMNGIKWHRIVPRAHARPLLVPSSASTRSCRAGTADPAAAASSKGPGHGKAWRELHHSVDATDARGCRCTKRLKDSKEHHLRVMPGPWRTKFWLVAHCSSFWLLTVLLDGAESTCSLISPVAHHHLHRLQTLKLLPQTSNPSEPLELGMPGFCTAPWISGRQLQLLARVWQSAVVNS